MKPRTPKPSKEVALLLAIVDEAYDRSAWHGPNLKGSLRRLTQEQAAWRPSAGRHSSWELAVHAAYWKYAVRRRLTGAKRGSFPLAGSNWFGRPDAGRSWRDDLLLLDEEHRRLRETIAALPASRLSRISPGTRHTGARLVYGIAAHDTYHAGQIRMLQTLRGGGEADEG
ncbi:MAG: DinB family protein [Acidobacteriota bacterium]|nr:DinB family protein [Acidobacteriota bacterium]